MRSTSSTTSSSPRQPQRYEPNYSCGCSCEVCHCGPNCQCTETLCRCEASSVLNSLSQSSRKSNPAVRQKQKQHQQPSSCCSPKQLKTNQASRNKDVTEAENTTPPLSWNVETVEEGIVNNTNNDQNCPDLIEVDVEVLGMTCSMCTKSVETALRNLPGIVNVTLSLPLNMAHVEYDASQTTRYQDIVDAIEAIGYDVPPPLEERSTPAIPTTSVVEFTISGMTCSMCTQAINRALQAVQGVEQASVSLSTNQAVVHFDGSFITVEELKETIEDIGYDVTDSMEVTVDDATGSADVGQATSPSNMMNPDRLDRLLQQQQEQVDKRKRSFILSLVGTVPILLLTMVLPHFQSLKLVQWLQQPIVVFHHEFVLEALILWALATPIQFGCGYPFYKSSYYGLRQRVMGMDVLIAVGTSSSYVYAVWAALAGGMEYHFFETSAVLICFVLLGKWMQTLAVRRTSQALTRLLQLQPRTAIKVIVPTDNKSWNPLNNDPYSEEVVPISTIQTGDYVKVLKGSSIPADGAIRFGEMTVDESMITGESIPVLKTKGAIVLGGTICAEAGQEAGACFVQVTGVGSNTALSQILQLVQDAQNRHVPIQNLADTISGYFVPTVVILSIVTFMVWYALIQSGVIPSSMLPDGESPATFSLLFAIACVVCSCPCALGLATPTAVMVGTGVGANQGVLMKGGETLELASKVDAIVFDKTGTLTRGKPAITDFSVIVTDNVFWKEILGREPGALKKGKGLLPMDSTEECLLWLLASLERNSEHLLATAIVEYADQKLTRKNHGTTESDFGRQPGTTANIAYAQPSNFIALTGRGASGRILGDIDVSVGNRAFCDVQGFEVSQQVEDNMRRLERHGKTAIVAAVNGVVAVVMGVADELKPDAASSVVYLKEKLGVDVWMVTGDNRRTARAIAQQLHLPADRVIAEALPVAKVEKVQELQEQGHIVAMVGDGVNDSPALVQADVGLSMGTGAEIAAEASDMVLVRGNVADVCTALDLSRVIFSRIKVSFSTILDSSPMVLPPQLPPTPLYLFM
jgi:P-type Cu+ transporter